MVKNQVQEGVGYFVRESKLKAIEYAKKTFAYDFYVKVIFLKFFKQLQAKGAKQTYDTLEITVNHSFSLEQEMNFRTDEFRQALLEDVRIYILLIDVVCFLLSLFYIPIIAWPFIQVLYLNYFFMF